MNKDKFSKRKENHYCKKQLSLIALKKYEERNESFLIHDRSVSLISGVFDFKDWCLIIIHTIVPLLDYKGLRQCLILVLLGFSRQVMLFVLM